jgi:cupin 2 domain-containing protein
MTTDAGNIFSPLPMNAADEHISTLLVSESVRIERIVSHGHVSPEGFWYDQDWAEWVIVLKGSAALLFEHEGAPRLLSPGDYVLRARPGAIAPEHGLSGRPYSSIRRGSGGV